MHPVHLHAAKSTDGLAHIAPCTDMQVCSCIRMGKPEMVHRRLLDAAQAMREYARHMGETLLQQPSLQQGTMQQQHLLCLSSTA